MSSHKSILSFIDPKLNTNSNHSFKRNVEEKSVDLWEIDTVPTDFESVSKPSKIIENLLKKKKEQHENSLKEMNRELDVIQNNCAKQIKDSSENLLETITDIRKNIEDIKKKFENDMRRYTVEGCKNTRNILIKILEKEIILINKFSDQLKTIERDRSINVKKTLSKYLDILKSIAYIVPENIKILTTDELNKYNELILDNYEIYELVCLKMKLNNHKLKLELDDWLTKIKIWKNKN